MQDLRNVVFQYDKPTDSQLPSNTEDTGLKGSVQKCIFKQITKYQKIYSRISKDFF